MSKKLQMGLSLSCSISREILMCAQGGMYNTWVRIHYNIAHIREKMEIVCVSINGRTNKLKGILQSSENATCINMEKSQKCNAEEKNPTLSNDIQSVINFT